MAELIPNYLQEACYTAQLDRLLISGLVCTDGVADVSGGSLLVTTGGSALNVSIAQGGFFADGDDDDRGTYYGYNDAAVTVATSAADPTNPRIDQIIARVYDSSYGEGADEWTLETLTGTPTGGATLTNLNGAASLPDNSIRLAYVLVPAAFAGPFVNATHILDARTEFVSCGQNGLRQIVKFTAGGTFSKATYPWLKSVKVRIAAGGGGGGGAVTTTAARGAAGAGGGAGGYAEVVKLASALSASETVTVGAAGTGAAAGNNTGGTGGASSFGAHASVAGGVGGGGGDYNGLSSAVDSQGGAGGAATVGDVLRPGGRGENGLVLGSGSYAYPSAGMGGSGPLGAGGAPGAESAGAAGTGYGSGGGGGGSNGDSGTARAGGAGAAGVVIVELYG